MITAVDHPLYSQLNDIENDDSRDRIEHKGLLLGFDKPNNKEIENYSRKVFHALLLVGYDSKFKMLIGRESRNTYGYKGYMRVREEELSKTFKQFAFLSIDVEDMEISDVPTGYISPMKIKKQLNRSIDGSATRGLIDEWGEYDIVVGGRKVIYWNMRFNVWYDPITLTNTSIDSKIFTFAVLDGNNFWLDEKFVKFYTAVKGASETFKELKSNGNIAVDAETALKGKQFEIGLIQQIDLKAEWEKAKGKATKVSSTEFLKIIKRKPEGDAVERFFNICNNEEVYNAGRHNDQRLFSFFEIGNRYGSSPRPDAVTRAVEAEDLFYLSKTKKLFLINSLK